MKTVFDRLQTDSAWSHHILDLIPITKVQSVPLADLGVGPGFLL